MIIGISGKRGVGKTTSTNYLVKKYGFTKVGFADDLKLMAKMFYPFTDYDFGSGKEHKYKGHEWTPREFLLHLGELMRYHDKDYWLKRLMAKCVDETKNYCIDDLRFKNEAQAIVIGGGKLIRIERYEKKNPYGKDLDIPSEKDLDDYAFDYTVPKVRNCSMTELEKQLDGFMGEIFPIE